MPRLKNQNKKISIKECTSCFKSNNIIFNFAYIVYDDDLDDNAKRTLIDRLREVSSVNYLELTRWPREKGFEEVKVNISKEIPRNFLNEIGAFDGKYSIMRLYKNNEPTPGRIIEKLINKIFYIYYIDVKGNLYNN